MPRKTPLPRREVLCSKSGLLKTVKSQRTYAEKKAYYIQTDPAKWQLFLRRKQGYIQKWKSKLTEEKKQLLKERLKRYNQIKKEKIKADIAAGKHVPKKPKTPHKPKTDTSRMKERVKAATIRCPKQINKLQKHALLRPEVANCNLMTFEEHERHMKLFLADVHSIAQPFTLLSRSDYVLISKFLKSPDTMDCKDSMKIFLAKYKVHLRRGSTLQGLMQETLLCKNWSRLLTVLTDDVLYSVVSDVHIKKFNHYGGFKKTQSYLDLYFYGVAPLFVWEFCRSCPVCHDPNIDDIKLTDDLFEKDGDFWFYPRLDGKIELLERFDDFYVAYEPKDFPKAKRRGKHKNKTAKEAVPASETNVQEGSEVIPVPALNAGHVSDNEDGDYLPHDLFTDVSFDDFLCDETNKKSAAFKPTLPNQHFDPQTHSPFKGNTFAGQDFFQGQKPATPYYDPRRSFCLPRNGEEAMELAPPPLPMVTDGARITHYPTPWPNMPPVLPGNIQPQLPCPSVVPVPCPAPRPSEDPDLRFMDRVQVDLIDVTCKPDRDFKFICHAIDLFSKFRVTFPLKNSSAEEIAAGLRDRVFCFGVPRIIHPNSGRHHIKQAFPLLVKQLPTITLIEGKPRCIISFEKITHEIKSELVKANKRHTGEGEFRWSEHLAQIMLTLNQRVESPAVTSPFTAVFGYDPSPGSSLFGLEGRVIEEKDLPKQAPNFKIPQLLTYDS